MEIQVGLLLGMGTRQGLIKPTPGLELLISSSWYCQDKSMKLERQLYSDLFSGLWFCRWSSSSFSPVLQNPEKTESLQERWRLFLKTALYFCSPAVRAFETAPCILDHRRVVSGRSWTCCLTYCKRPGRLLRLWAGRCKSDFQLDRRPTGPLNGGQARKCLVKILSFSLLQPDLDQYHIPMLLKNTSQDNQQLLYVDWRDQQNPKDVVLTPIQLKAFSEFKERRKLRETDEELSCLV